MSEVGMGVRQSGLKDIVGRAGAAPYVTTVFLSASMVMLVQPMFAKMATPLLGGAPAVWNVSLVCFQAALLLGYAYAHVLARLSSVKAQVAIHGALLMLAALALPLSISTMFGTPNPSNPVLWLAGTFMVSIAPPFALISATAPLIQNWYARSGRPDAADPYHLYASSNVGSLLGLAAYPLLIEPLTSLSTQTGLWAGGYGILVLLLVGCGLLAAAGNRQAYATGASEAADASTDDTPMEGRWKERLYWLALAAVPSGLLLGVTTHISTDVASAPFLWAPPLMAYFLTFIIVFSKKPMISTATAQRFLPHAVGGAIALIALQGLLRVPLVVGFSLHIAALFMASLALHGALAERRPHASRLTEFYLLMSLGGVVGSALVALAAPMVFSTILEYPLMLGLALLLSPTGMSFSDSFSKGRVYILVALAFGLAVSASGAFGLRMDPAAYRAGTVILIAIALVQFQSRLVPVAALTGALLVGWTGNPVRSATSERGFFGVIKTVEWKHENLRMMMHGTTLHGAQLIEDDARPTPLTYYHDDAPIGQAFMATRNSAKTVGVVGLGVGSVACHAQPGQAYTYYEIDPLVAEVAKDGSRFTFLSTCTPDAPVVLGDARITLADAPLGGYDLLLMDAFSSDAVPAHLLTREAMALYLSRLSEDGLIVFHVSNRHLDLMPTLARVGAAEGAVMMKQRFRPEAGEIANGPIASDVVILAKTQAGFAGMDQDDRWETLTADDKRAWTDDYTNIIGAMLEHRKAE